MPKLSTLIVHFVASVSLIGGNLCLADTVAPAFPQLVHLDHETVTALNSHQATWLTTETNLLLLDKLGWTGKVQEMPTARIDASMQSRPNICTLDRVKTKQRQQVALFSKPVNFFVSYRLYQHASQPEIAATFLDEEGAVRNLAGMLRQSKSQLLVPRHFSYGNVVDAEIQHIRPHQRVDVDGVDYFQQLIGMFAARRADYVIVYPTAVHTHFGGDWPMPVRSYAIAGTPAVTTGHIMCSDTPSNRQWLQRVDAALDALYNDPKFLQAHLKYLPTNEQLTVKFAIKAASN